jgi:hypothetical protein
MIKLRDLMEDIYSYGGGAPQASQDGYNTTGWPEEDKAQLSNPAQNDPMSKRSSEINFGLKDVPSDYPFDSEIGAQTPVDRADEMKLSSLVPELAYGQTKIGIDDYGNTIDEPLSDAERRKKGPTKQQIANRGTAAARGTGGWGNSVAGGIGM